MCAGRRLCDVLDRRELGVIDGRRTRQNADHFGFRGQAVHRSRQECRSRGLVVIAVAVAVVVFVIHSRGRHRHSGRRAKGIGGRQAGTGQRHGRAADDRRIGHGWLPSAAARTAGRCV